MNVYTTGTLGDAFIILLKLYDKPVNRIEHYSAHKQVYNIVKQIYSLIPSKPEVVFLDDKKESDSIKGCIFDGETYNPFPEFNLVDSMETKGYNVVSVQSGVDIKRTPWKQLSESDMLSIPNDKPLVLIGTDNRDVKFKDYDVLDLRSKTNLKNSFGLIKHSDAFYGTQGLLSFVALSQKVHTKLWIKDKSDELAVQCRIHKIPEWSTYIKYAT